MTNKFQASITPPDATLDEEIWSKINLKTKPVGSLGKLERLAFQIARIQQTLTPKLSRPAVLVFAGQQHFFY